MTAMGQLAPTRLALLLLSKILFNAEAICGIQERRYLDEAITTRLGFRLYGHVLKTLRVTSLPSCAQHCLKESRCVSTNFKHLKQERKGVCELNDAGFLDGKGNHFVPEKDVVFSQYGEDKYVLDHSRPNREVSHDFAFEFLSTSTTDSVILIRSFPKLQAFTLCFWMKTNDRSNMGTPFSYELATRTNELVLKNYKKFRFQVGDKSPGKSIIDVSANDGKWHHICLTWENTAGSWNFYKDRILEVSGEGLRARYVIESGGRFMMGQNQADLKKEKSFIGLLAHLNIWDHVLSKDNITFLSRSCLSEEGNAVKWSDFKQGVKGKVRMVTPSPCKP